MTGFYAAMATVTAVHIWRVNHPTEFGHWIAFAIMVALWPLTIAVVAVGLGAWLRDRDATRSAAAKTPVPQDLQARPEGIAQPLSGSDLPPRKDARS